MIEKVESHVIDYVISCDFSKKHVNNISQKANKNNKFKDRIVIYKRHR